MINKKRQLPVETLGELLRYQPDSGLLFWKRRDRKYFPSDRDWKGWNTQFANREAFAGCSNQGYRQGYIFYVHYLAHRVAWALHHDEWPEDQIDHQNGLREDNRISNLRCVSNARNQQNACRRKDNMSGVTGICLHKATAKFQANIKVNGKQKHLGLFETIAEAAAAREAAEVKYGYHPNHGREA